MSWLTPFFLTALVMSASAQQPPTSGTGEEAQEPPTTPDTSARPVPKVEAPEPNEPPVLPQLVVENISLLQFVRQVSDLTGESYVIDPQVRGQVSFLIRTPLTKSELQRVLMSALQINGFTVVPAGDFKKIVSSRNAQRDNIPVIKGSEAMPPGMITKVIPLKNLSPDQVNKSLRILPSKDGEMTPIDNPPAIIMSDYASNLERVEDILRHLDDNAEDTKPLVVHLKDSQAATLATAINDLYGVNSELRYDRESGKPYPVKGRPLVVANMETNSLVIGGTPDQRKQILTLIEELESAPFRWNANLTILAIVAGFAILGFLVLARQPRSS